MNFYGKRYSYENGLISKEGREVCYLQSGMIAPRTRRPSRM